MSRFRLAARRSTRNRAVKRLCRDGDTLLSRPGRGAALRFADRRDRGDFQARGLRRFKTARDQVSGTFMPQKVRIALDAMGGDVGASVVIPGAAISLTRHPDTEFLLFGDRALIEPQLAKHPAMKAVSRVIHTDVAVSMHDKPSQALAPRPQDLLDVAGDRGGQEGRGRRRDLRRQYRRAGGDGAVLPAHAARASTGRRWRRSGRRRAAIRWCSISAPPSAAMRIIWWRWR